MKMRGETHDKSLKDQRSLSLEAFRCNPGSRVLGAAGAAKTCSKMYALRSAQNMTTPMHHYSWEQIMGPRVWKFTQKQSKNSVDGVVGH